MPPDNDEHPETLSAFERKVGGQKKRPAPRTFKLKPEHFADTWGNRPVSPITIGLRVPPDRDYQTAEAEASKVVAELNGDEATRKFNTSLVVFCVARGICNPHDVTQPHPYFELAEDELPLALTSNTLQRVFDEIELLAIEQSPIFVEASAQELRQLTELLSTDDPFELVTQIERKRCLRYLKIVLDTLNFDG